MAVGRILDLGEAATVPTAAVPTPTIPTAAIPTNLGQLHVGWVRVILFASLVIGVDVWKFVVG